MVAIYGIPGQNEERGNSELNNRVFEEENHFTDRD
jgi:hypothetical protein